jgi:hypothetical protein
MKSKKYYYHDEENDLLEYIDGTEDGVVASWVNPYLTLFFPHGCDELIPKNIVGFQINGLRRMMHKAEEQAAIPLTPKQQGQIDKMLTEMGWGPSINENGEEVWAKEDKE